MLLLLPVLLESRIGRWSDGNSIKRDIYLYYIGHRTDDERMRESLADYVSTVSIGRRIITHFADYIDVLADHDQTITELVTQLLRLCQERLKPSHQFGKTYIFHKHQMCGFFGLY